MLTTGWESRHLIGDGCRMFVRAAIDLESNWKNILSMRGGDGARWSGFGGKHLERSLSFNDMQQMWNEAGAAPAM